ncbi:MAG: DNA-3-methyladenine glycosylase I [Myxococcota bacterium]
MERRITAREKTRCSWCGTSDIYVAYHDDDWGVPERDDRALYEKLILDGFQAGLSWLTILRKRDNFRTAFDGFDPEKIARWRKAKIERLMGDAGIVRNRAKIEAAKTNARAYLALRESGITFSDYLWDFVDGETIQNRWRRLKQLPAETQASRAMAKNLKKRGFRFCGPTICYAFMQAVGMVNDHLVDCFRYEQLGARRQR